MINRSAAGIELSMDESIGNVDLNYEIDEDDFDNDDDDEDIEVIDDRLQDLESNSNDDEVSLVTGTHLIFKKKNRIKTPV